VEAKESGRTAHAEQGKATYNATFVENAAIGLVKQAGTALMSLNLFKEFIERH
jgi:hypothetical protein